jgi:hypothetical protein
MTDEQWARYINQALIFSRDRIIALDSNYLKIIRLLYSTRDWLFGTTIFFTRFGKGNVLQCSLETVAAAS